jgi:hypothetical protein
MAGTFRRAAVAGLVALLFGLSPLARAQNVTGETYSNVKSETSLTPPDGATNMRAKGTAKTFYVDNGHSVMQRLQVTAQRLDRGVSYRLLIDGLDFGVYSPRGGSGTLALRFRDPVKGNLLPFPDGVAVDVRTFVTIQIVNDTTGEIALQGTFAS